MAGLILSSHGCVQPDRCAATSVPTGGACPPASNHDNQLRMESVGRVLLVPGPIVPSLSHLKYLRST